MTWKTLCVMLYPDEQHHIEDVFRAHSHLADKEHGFVNVPFDKMVMGLWSAVAVPIIGYVVKRICERKRRLRRGHEKLTLGELDDIERRFEQMAVSLGHDEQKASSPLNNLVFCGEYQAAAQRQISRPRGRRNRLQLAQVAFIASQRP